MKTLHFAAALLFVVLYSNPADAAKFTLLHGFHVNANDGGEPLASLTLSGQTLYGTTSAGGPGDGGTIFTLNTDGTGFQLLHSFDVVNDGYRSSDSLTLSGQTLYGTASAGGAGSGGTIFKLNTDGTGFQVLRSFAFRGNDGYHPQASLTLSGSTLYGTTSYGGPSDSGTVFKLNTDGTGFQLLHTFSGGAIDGKEPASSLMLSGDTLYGTTESGGGGTSGGGTVFKLNTDGTGFQLLHAFTGGPNDGSKPYSSLTLSGQTFYGTTAYGGRNGFGTVFKLNTDGTDFQLLRSFGDATGYVPFASLTRRDQALYGTTSNVGPGGGGTVFKLNTDGTHFQLLHAFADGANDGAGPQASLTTSGETFYGTSQYGGPSGRGVVFAITDRVLKPFALTRFDEPPLGATSYVPGFVSRELGFNAGYSPTGFNPLAGVTAIGANRVLTHQSVSASTLFLPIDLSDWTDVEVSVDLQVSATTFEAGDFLHIYARKTNSGQSIDLFNQIGSSGGDLLDSLAGTNFLTFSAAIPDDWNSVTLVIQSSSNSSQGLERYDFDNIVFSGLPVPVPEPTSLALAALAGVGCMAGCFVKCRQSREL